MSAPELEGQVAIVTGAAMGIGKACAMKLAAAGATVVIADVERDAGAATAADITATASGHAHYVHCDVTSMASMRELAEETTSTYGGIDILINNAARAIGGKAHEIDEETWNTVINTNLTGFWRGFKVCVPSMIERGGGAVVNVSSAQASVGFRGWAAYAAAKGGVNALTRQTAIDLAPHNIRVNGVAPGTIMTPMNEKIFADSEDPESLIDTWNNAHPIGRFGQAEEVGAVVAFLVGPGASFMTGEIVRVDGGQLAAGE